MYEKNLKSTKIFNLAYRNYQSNNFKIAENLCLKLLKIQPNHFETIFLLGTISAQLKNLIEAKKFLQKAIKIRPNFVFAYNNLGNVLNELGEIINALNCYKKAIEIKPNYLIAVNNLCILLKSIKLKNLDEKNKTFLKKLFLILLRRNDIEHSDLFSNAKLFLFSERNKNRIENLINSNISLLDKEEIKTFLKEELLLLMLQKSVVADQFLEKILTKLRLEILFAFVESNIKLSKKYYNFVISISAQCFLNEYVFSQSSKENKFVKKLLILMEKRKKIDELGVAILGCYMPIVFSKNIKKKLLRYKKKNILFNDLISMQIKEPLQEKELLNSIQSFGKISDLISKKVRKQYEENPYPRWRFTYVKEPSNFLNVLNNQLKPNRVKSEHKFKNPNMLIAGCGTGSHIVVAEEYSNTKILGVDLSLASLAYAKRKTQELGFKNIEFLHADILELKNFSRKFDIIESIGTLHHMKNPKMGLEILMDLLEPHGFLKLGLYSEIARKHIIKTKKFLKENNYNNLRNISKYREMIKNKLENRSFQKVLDRADFYSTSSAIDLIFHAQEHCFTIPQLSKILRNLNLEFMGFSNSFIKTKYAKFYPDDKNNLNLNYWNQFERDNPDTFIGMYKFWVRRKFS